MDFKVRVVDQYGGMAKVEALIAALKMLQSPGPQVPGEQAAFDAGEQGRKWRTTDDSWKPSVDQEES